MLPIGPYTLKNRFILAPMAGVSEMPFRTIAFELGAALCPTELVSAQGLFRINTRTLRYLRFNAEIERPYSLQIFGGEPEVMAEAAVIGKKHGAQLIDINMGCPVKKVTKTGAGSGLLCDPPRAGLLVKLIREATGLPVTAKIRSGWDSSQRNYLEMADVLGAAGVAALAVHPRTRAQGYSGKADWTVIADLKRHVGNRFPIIGNGDVKSVDDATRMTEQTGCDYVMIGRGALGNPWLFRELNGGPKPTREERATLVMRHFKEHLHFVAHERVSREKLSSEEEAARAEKAGVHNFRKHLAWYAHGLSGASVFRNLINRLDTRAEVEAAVEQFFLGAEDDAHGAQEEYDVDYRTALG
ncbi:MAG: tRNA dihydrouridine synthase DusB [Myxococcaceae bacterium]|jgi:tRNA-dihydrouridine synthase B|nr:tRNA dihydrouridine synthase DusB [Myxococcaceae bacterium]MCA3012895.1 tRNA dihydrouridine synthase DusB [Myxococcaceae bacterium]